MKLQHWRASWDIFALKGAPVLEFVIEISKNFTVRPEPVEGLDALS